MSKITKLLVLVAVAATIALPGAVMAQPAQPTPPPTTAPSTTPPAVAPTPAPAPAAPAMAVPNKGDKPYSNGDVIKTWDNVTGTFTLGGVEKMIKGFTVKRVVSSEPTDTIFYYKENANFWTWSEAYMVTPPANGRDLGFFTSRPGKTSATAGAQAPVAKIYTATPPSAPTTTGAGAPPKTGWKKGEDLIRSK
jgi:hypothetical protein